MIPPQSGVTHASTVMVLRKMSPTTLGPRSPLAESPRISPALRLPLASSFPTPR